MVGLARLGREVGFREKTGPAPGRRRRSGWLRLLADGAETLLNLDFRAVVPAWDIGRRGLQKRIRNVFASTHLAFIRDGVLRSKRQEWQPNENTA